MPRTEEEMMDVLGSESAYNQVKDAADALDAFEKGKQVSDLLLSTSGGAGGGGGVRGMQRELAGIGMPVRVTGKVDQATVDAVNAVFHGWDDAPALLRNGDLSARQISQNLPFVEKYVRKAIGGAQEFGDATKDG